MLGCTSEENLAGIGSVNPVVLETGPSFSLHGIRPPRVTSTFTCLPVCVYTCLRRPEASDPLGSGGYRQMSGIQNGHRKRSSGPWQELYVLLIGVPSSQAPWPLNFELLIDPDIILFGLGTL